jgi:hypothetical protein
MQIPACLFESVSSQHCSAPKDDHPIEFRLLSRAEVRKHSDLQCGHDTCQANLDAVGGSTVAATYLSKNFEMSRREYALSRVTR